ncbi:MAG: hypothetical protein PVJ57_14380 [Phycisphaerae bacterium]
MFETANYIEAGLWGVIGVAFLVRALLRAASRRVALLAAGVFIAFGLSDVVEAHTGAWWKPPWLFVWKAICVVAMVGLLIWYQRSRRTREPR